MSIKDLIENRIQVGEAIMPILDAMKVVPSGYINVTSYDKDDVDKCRSILMKWQLTTKEVLLSIYGDSHRYLESFNNTITEKNGGYNFKREFKSELTKGIGVLESIVETKNIGVSEQVKPNHNLSMSKPPKIFISHKTEDKPFVDELIKMLEFIVGPNTKRIFCSSAGGYDIKPGRDILSELERQFEENEIIFVIVHSPRYYTSPICLNEMGAAWILGNRFFSFLTSDCPFSILKGVIDSKYISIKVNDPQETVVSKLNAFKDYLLDLFDVDKEGFNSTKWEAIRNEFILRTSSMKPDVSNKTKEEKGKSSPVPKANIMAELVSKNPFIVNIVNRGEGDAKHLNVKLSEDCENMLVSGMEFFPFENLKAGKYISLNIYPCLGDPDILRMTFTWEEKGIEFSSNDFVSI